MTPFSQTDRQTQIEAFSQIDRQTKKRFLRQKGSHRQTGREALTHTGRQRSILTVEQTEKVYQRQPDKQRRVLTVKQTRHGSVSVRQTEIRFHIQAGKGCH